MLCLHVFERASLFPAQHGDSQSHEAMLLTTVLAVEYRRRVFITSVSMERQLLQQVTKVVTFLPFD